MAKCCAISAGQMRHKVTLQRENSTQDADGQPVPTWLNYRSCRAKVEDKTGREIARGDQVEALVGTVVTIRYPRSGRFPSPQDRVVYRETSSLSRTLNIAAVKRLDVSQQFIELHCMEVQ